MNNNPQNEPPAREESRETVHGALSQAPGPMSKSQAQKFVNEGFKSALDVFATRAEIHAEIRAAVQSEFRSADKKSADAEKELRDKIEILASENAALKTKIENLEKNTPSKETVARADTKAGIALTIALAVVLATVAALWKIFGDN